MLVRSEDHVHSWRAFHPEHQVNVNNAPGTPFIARVPVVHPILIVAFVVAFVVASWQSATRGPWGASGGLPLPVLVLLLVELAGSMVLGIKAVPAQLIVATARWTIISNLIAQYQDTTPGLLRESM